MTTVNEKKLEYCEVCATTKAKYTCPKCEVRTCCIACINIHKKELDCDGIRNKTKFIQMKSFTDLDILSDYRLLEEVGRSVNILKKNMEQRKIMTQTLPTHLYKLKCAAFKRKVNLLLMPFMFSRRKENTTFLNWKTNELFWRIKWIFPQVENTECIMEKASDTIRLSKLIEQILDPASFCKDKIDETLNANIILSDKLQFYRAVGLSNIRILLKAEKMKNANSKFYDLDITLSLRENLENKTIVEYPIFYVIMKEHSSIFDIIDSDEEIEDSDHEERKRKNSDVSNNNKRQKTKKEGSVNYFFDDFSDEEEEESKKLQDKLQDKSSCGLNIPYYEDLIKDNK